MTTAASIDAELFTSPRLMIVMGTGKKATGYTVIEHTVGRGYGAGRGFTLTKLFGGSDNESIGYDVFITKEGGQGKSDSCNCKGYLRHDRCKHHDAIRHFAESGRL